eukprot:scaffold30745_cov28-Tisochrysis_lutea.AAC.4
MDRRATYRLCKLGLRVELKQSPGERCGGALQFGLKRQRHGRTEREHQVRRLKIAVSEVGGELAHALLIVGTEGLSQKLEA